MPAPADTLPADEAAQNRAALARLRDIGMEAAELLLDEARAEKARTQQARTQPEPSAEPSRLPQITAALEKISRCIRRTIALYERLGQPAPKPRTNKEGMPLDVARRILARDVEEAIQECAEPEDAERLREDLYDRLDRPELDDDIEHRPLVQVMTEIRRDMGFEDQPGQPPWVRRTAAEWATLCDRARSPALHPTRFRGKPN